MKAGRTGFRVDEPSSDRSDNLVPPVMLSRAMSGPEQTTARTSRDQSCRTFCLKHLETVVKHLDIGRIQELQCELCVELQRFIA